MRKTVNIITCDRCGCRVAEERLARVSCKMFISAAGSPVQGGVEYTELCPICYKLIQNMVKRAGKTAPRGRRKADESKAKTVDKPTPTATMGKA